MVKDYMVKFKNLDEKMINFKTLFKSFAISRCEKLLSYKEANKRYYWSTISISIQIFFNYLFEFIRIFCI